MPHSKDKMNAIITELEIFKHSHSFHIKELSKKENALSEIINKLRKETSDNKNKSFLGGIFGGGGKHDKDDLELEMALLRSENENILSELEKCKSECEQVKRDYITEKNELETKLNAISRDNESLKEKIFNCTKEIHLNKSNSLAKELDKGRFLNEIAVKKQEIESLKEELKEKQKSHLTEVTFLKDELTSKVKSVEELKIDLKHLKAVHDTTEHKNDELLKEKRKYEESCEHHVEENKKLEKELNTLKDANAKLQSDIDSNKSRREQEMYEMKEQHEKELTKYKHEHCQLEQKYNDVFCLKQTLESKLNDKIHEIETLVKIKRKQEEELSQTKSDIESLQQKNRRFRKPKTGTF